MPNSPKVNNFMKNYLIFFFIFFVSPSIFAKEVKLFKNFGVDNPMSYQFVRTIAQDDNGFMWFGSHEGLHRFDGYQFLSFHHDDDRANSLSSDAISRIFIDSKQQFWVGTTGGGLNLYREQSEDFFHITTETKDLALSNDVINTLFEDSEGKLWIGTESGINILSKSQGKWEVKHILQELGNPNSLTHNTVHEIIETKDNKVWVATNGGGISIFDLQGYFIQTLKIGDKESSIYISKFVNSLHQDALGNVWIGTAENGLIKYDTKNGHYTHYVYDENDVSTIASNTIKTIYQDSHNQLWIATDKGLLIYNELANNFNRYTHEGNNQRSLSSNFILSVFEDKNNMIWIGTLTGVNSWDPRMATFSQHSAQTNENIINSNVTSFAQFKNGMVFFSTYSGGIYQFPANDIEISRLDLNQYFSELRIMTLLAEPDSDTLWVGTRGSGLFKIDLKSKNIIKYQYEVNNPHSISANSITDIIKDQQGNIWVSTFQQGLNKLNTDGSFTRFTQNDSASKQSISSNHILHLLEDHNGYLWIATYGGGLNRFDPKSETFIHIMHDKNVSKSLSNDIILFMLLDKYKNLWVGTQGTGLDILSYEDMKNENFSFKHLDSKDGMKSLTVFGIVQDIHEDIWLSTSEGISRYSPDNSEFKHFDLTHGLIDLEYNHSAIFSGANNTLYFGSGKGMSTINPEQINTSLSVPEVRLTSILKLNEPMPLGSNLSNLSQLEFDYSDQLISFEYVGLNYANPESTLYKYRLLGFDEEWIAAGKSRRATYTNLPAGIYTLQIIAGNNDNVWSKPGISLDILVKPAPWNTWWAYLLYAMAVALTLLVYSRFLNRKLLVEQQQKSYLKEQVKDKTQKLQSQNSELEHANILLEKSATVDKVTGVRSRRYLDIYIEQTSQLMNQIHQNILPVQRSTLPRLYVLMVQVNELTNISNSQLINITDLLLFSRNTDDLVVRWSDDTFAVIGYEKDNNAGELAARLASKFEKQFDDNIFMNIAYSFYPFNREQPMEISWDQVSVMIELGLTLTSEEPAIAWLGLCEPKLQPFSYLAVIQGADLATLKHNIQVKQG
ncbi:MAG: ligand-binding sensor domain-containing protein/GGDEF domain-containing protein [Colwellia sp.]|jgi:ligand-binding sensor domain-containing protein/GGDEF domain-containing protein